MQDDKVILNMLVLSEFYKDKITNVDTHKFLLIEPFIIDILDGTTAKTFEDIFNELSRFKPNEATLHNLLETYLNDEIIVTEKQNNTYRLNESKEVKDKISQYGKIRKEKKARWDEFKNYALKVIERSGATKITDFNINQHFLTFYNDILYSDEYTDNMFNKNINVEIGLFLEECHKNEYTECFSIMEDLLQGLFRTKAVLCGIEVFDKDKLPVIYLDNVFIGILLGWSDNVRHRSCKMIFEQLKANNFEMRIHRDTFDVIRASIKRYKNMRTQKHNIEFGSFYYYLQYQEPNNKVFNINPILIRNMQDKLRDKLKEYNIGIDQHCLIVSVNSADEKYHKIEKIRNERSVTNSATEHQTDYDYKIVKNYETKHHINETTLSTIKEIFLTYQYAIAKTAFTDHEDVLYTPVMPVRKFTKLLLLEKSIASNNNSELLQAIIKDSYSDVLSDTIIAFLTNFLKKPIEEDDKNFILAQALDTTNWGNILDEDNIEDIHTKNARRLKEAEETARAEKEAKEKAEETARAEKEAKEIAEEVARAEKEAKEIAEENARNLQKALDDKERENVKNLQKALYDKELENAKNLQKALYDKELENAKNLQEALDKKDKENIRTLEETIKKRDEERKEKRNLFISVIILLGILLIAIFLCVRYKVWNYDWGKAVLVGLAILYIFAFVAFFWKQLVKCFKKQKK